MSITATDVKNRFAGSFDDVSDDLIDELIAEAELIVKESGWGNLYNTGLKYYVGHLLQKTITAPGSGGASGPVTSRRVGEVAVTFASPAANSSSSSGGDLRATSYGQEFLRLQRLAQGGPVTPVLAAVPSVL